MGRKKKEKKGKKMNYWNYGKKEYEVSDKKVSTLFGISYFNQTDIDEFFKKSGALAETNEFQCHYTALTGIAKVENQVLLINIPLVYFNYPQEVGSASVKFELKDVSEKSNSLMEYAGMLAGDCMKKPFIKEITNLFPNIEWVVSGMNTIHRHPGNLSSFSGTDYDKDPTNPGICFPLSEADSAPSFSSIVCKHGNTMKIVHTETRLAHGSVAEQTMAYYHGRNLTYVQGYTCEPSLLERLFKVSDMNTSIPDYTTSDRCSFTDELIAVCKLIDFKGCTDNIVEENVKKETYKATGLYGGTYHNNYYKGRNTRVFVNGEWVDEEDYQAETKKELLPKQESTTKTTSTLLDDEEPIVFPDMNEITAEPVDELSPSFKGDMIDFIYDSENELGSIEVNYLAFSKAKKDILIDILISELSTDEEEEEYLMKMPQDTIINLACNKGVLMRKRPAYNEDEGGFE